MRRTASLIVEFLAVLFVVGLLAVVAIPDRGARLPQTEQRKALISRLEQVRTAVDRYWGYHDAAYPTLREVQALTRVNGRPKLRTGLAVYLARVPENPFTGNNEVAPMDAATGESDWVYDESTGVFKANDSVDNRSL